MPRAAAGSRCYAATMKTTLRLLLIAALPLLMADCSGRAGTACRSSSECAKNLECAGPNDPPVCGMPPRMGCTGNIDCGSGLFCHAIFDPCSASGVGSECGPRCGACQFGFRCGSGGACEPQPCDEGFRCSAPTVCDPSAAHRGGPVYERTQGCVTIACTFDDACPADQACVSGFCQTGPGECQPVMIVP